MSNQSPPSNCPLCHRKMREIPEAFDAYGCPTQITYADVYADCMPIPHYVWQFHQQIWFVGPYKLEQDESGLSIYKFNPRGYRTDYRSKPSWNYMMFLETQIQIDDSNKTLKKIKTIITFS